MDMELYQLLSYVPYWKLHLYYLMHIALNEWNILVLHAVKVAGGNHKIQSSKYSKHLCRQPLVCKALH